MADAADAERYRFVPHRSSPSQDICGATVADALLFPPLHSPLKEAELAVLRKQYESEGESVGVQTKFNYAWGLIKSEKRQEQQLGVKLLTG